MIEFIDFKKAVSAKMQHMLESQLFRVDIDKYKIWDVYLSAFPEGTNPIYKERTEHDCNCCKQFIRDAGGVVALRDGELISVWDVEIGHPYNAVAKALSEYVKSRPIKNVFFHYSSTIGTDSNKQMLENGTVTTWNHFYSKLPACLVKHKDGLGGIYSEIRSGHDVFRRALDEMSTATIETVLELIEQNSLYRGEEHKTIVERFLSLKREYDKIDSESPRDFFCWEQSIKSQAVARIRNSVIGSLMVDIEEGKDLDVAVRAFETKVAPSNYKRPTSIITKSMIESAQKEVEQLGLTKSLERRHATKDDISVNDVIFTNTASSCQSGNVFDSMKSDVPISLKELKRVEEVSINRFINDIVPKATAIELLFENRHINNLLNIIAPVYPEAKPLFKWDNGFSWSYNGDVTDSVKERVKKAGGCVDGVLRCSLSWFNFDDLDIHVKEPDANHIYFGNKRSASTGHLDIDMNVGVPVRDAVENIVWTDESSMEEGEYVVFVHNYTKREDKDVGFVVEIDYKGDSRTFGYDRLVKHGENVQVAKFRYSKKDGITFIESIPEANISKNVWGIDTQKYHDVKMMLTSPNHWSGKAIGNKHWFFILDKCLNPSSARGIYNEFLTEELREHRKVFEVLASKTKVPTSEEQLCGLGFSSTKKDCFYCRVSGSFSRVIKVNII